MIYPIILLADIEKEWNILTMTEVNLYGNHITSHSQPHAKLRVHSVDVLYADNTTVFWTNTHDNTLLSMPISSTQEEAAGRDGRTRRDSPSSPFSVVVSFVIKERNGCNT